MLDITLSTVGYEYKERLIEIWCECFGDDREYVSELIDLLFDNGTVAVGAFVNGYLAAAEYLIKCEYDGERAYYGYAVGTDKRYRGLGICTLMQLKITSAAKDKGFSYFLSPASESLEGYYKKTGLTTEFYTYEVNIPSKDAPVTEGKRISAEEYLKKRREYLEDKAGMPYVTIPAPLLDFEYSFYDAGSFCYSAEEADGILRVLEVTGDYDGEYFASLAGAKGCKGARVYLASFRGIGEKKTTMLAPPFVKSGYFTFTLG